VLLEKLLGALRGTEASDNSQTKDLRRTPNWILLLER